MTRTGVYVELMALRIFWELVILICASTTFRILLLPLPVARGDEAVDFFNSKEALVKEIAKNALENYKNASDSVATCISNPSYCSRAVCRPLKRDLADGTRSCVYVPNNIDCQNANGSTCTKAWVSWDEAYVRYPPDADIDKPSCDMLATICAQKELDDQIFKQSLSVNVDPSFTLDAWTYFGASNGIDRIYPGKELNETACGTYDIRERPWYAGATAVLKDVVVMLDAGATMGQRLSHFTSATVFDASKTITLRLLNTLTAGDSMSVLTFGPSPLSSKQVVEKTSINSTPAASDPTALEPLRDHILSLPNPSLSGSSATNLTDALIGARDQFMGDNSDSPQIKVIIIITAGNQLTGTDLQKDLVDSLTEMNVVVFIYRVLFYDPFGFANDNTTDLLSSISCKLYGWYEEGPYDTQNPLGTIQSFYSYFAQLRFDYNNTPFWVGEYEAYSGIGNLVTVAYPVLFDGIFLVGVAGVDVMADNLGSISDDVLTLLSNRQSGSNPISLTFKAVPCGQKLPQQGTSCANNSPSVTGICPAELKYSPSVSNSSFFDRVCCEGCRGKPLILSGHNDLSTVAKIGIVSSVFAGILFLLLVCRGVSCAGCCGR